MTDAAIQSISLVVIALFSTIGTVTIAWFSYLTSQSAKQAAKTTEVTQEIARETHAVALKTELNTNSMKDALVESTRVAALLKGKQDERAAGDARKASEAEGRAEGRKEIADRKLDTVVAEAVGIKEGPVEGEVKGGSLTVESKT